MKQLYILISLIFTFTACLPIGDTGGKRIRKTACTVENDQCSTLLGVGYFCLNNFCAECDATGDHNCNDSTKPVCFENKCVVCTAADDDLCTRDGKVCGRDNTCVPEGGATECTVVNEVTDCTDPSKPACVDGVCKICSNNEHCLNMGSGYVCNQATNSCDYTGGGGTTYKTLLTPCSNYNEMAYCKYSSTSTEFSCKCGQNFNSDLSWVIPNSSQCSKTYGIPANNYACEYANECNSSNFCKPPLVFYELLSDCNSTTPQSCYYPGFSSNANFDCECYSSKWRISNDRPCWSDWTGNEVCIGSKLCKPDSSSNYKCLAPGH